MGQAFDYQTAFSRNIGWVSKDEQQVLRGKRIAIAGLGGVGGSHLLTLSRLGVGAFHIADYDAFELANFNRQAGASMTSIGRQKAEVLCEQAKAINPELDVKVFPAGVSAENLGDFLCDVDLYVDSLDFFALPIRQAVFAACAQAGIPAITAAPLGMGTALLNFLPGKMTFEEYFLLEGQSDDEQLVRFLLGLSPAMLQRGYLVDPSAVDFAAKKGPSTPMACELCAGVAATQALKILLNRGKVLAAPWGLHFDAYTNKLAKTWRPGGNRNPLQQLGLAIARRQLAAMGRGAHRESDLAPESAALKVIERARWAPSGDNAQPWRFEVEDETRFRVLGFDTRDFCIYDLRGQASQLAQGALLETIAIAASGLGFDAQVVEAESSGAGGLAFKVALQPAGDDHVANPLAPFIGLRVVQRKPMSLRALSEQQKTALEYAVGSDFEVRWFEGVAGRWAMANLYFHSAGLRLALPEAYETHRDAVDWHADFSEDRIPVKAVGFNPLSAILTAWAMESRQRVQNLNKLGGSLLARLELDLVPGMLCGAHFALLAKQAPATPMDHVAAGRAVQRFWLTAAKLGLQLQPQTTPLIFHQYVRDDVDFTDTPGMVERAQGVSDHLKSLLGGDAVDRAVFLGRMGAGPAARYRSTRLPLQQLVNPSS